MAAPVKGVKIDSVGAAPQSTGLASGARGPPFVVTLSSLNGSGGFSVKLASSLPVAALALTRPLTRIETPYTLSASR